MDASDLPGVIVVAEQSLYDLLAAQSIGWWLGERQDCVAQMWDGLSSGMLDAYARILIFSDALRAGTDADGPELAQTAWAVAAMAGAGAQVFVSVWRPADAAALDRQIVEAAQAQGLDPGRLDYHALPAAEPAHLVLSTLREVLGADVAFPDRWTGAVDRPLTRVAGRLVGLPTRPPDRPASGLPLAPPGQADEIAQREADGPAEADEPAEDQRDEGRAEPQPDHSADSPRNLSPAFVREVILDDGWSRPGLPQITGVVAPVDGWSPKYPPQASNDLLARPIPNGQSTIVVTSSKGGAGKTTVSVMLAASIARASLEAGHRLSVVVVDLDTFHGQISSIVGVLMPTALNIRVQPRWDEACLRRNIVRAENLRIDTLLAPVRPRTAQIVGPEFYRPVIASLKRMYDIVILDTGNHYLDPLVADVALVEANLVLFVTTMAATSVQGMARALADLTATRDDGGQGVPADRIGIVVNQAAGGVGIDSEGLVSASLGVPIIAAVPLATKEVLTATNTGRMADLLDHHLLGPAYNDLARACLPSRALAPWREPVTEPPKPAPVFSLADSAAGGEPARRGLFRR